MRVPEMPVVNVDTVHGEHILHFTNNGSVRRLNAVVPDHKISNEGNAKWYQFKSGQCSVVDPIRSDQKLLAGSGKNHSQSGQLWIRKILKQNYTEKLINLTISQQNAHFKNK
jgi:hypothetical protein